jgi:hypothetical protein
MSFFECCRDCPSTKRHPGCHGNCKDYLDQKKQWEDCKEEMRKENLVPPAKTDYLNMPVWYNYRKR